MNIASDLFLYRTGQPSYRRAGRSCCRNETGENIFRGITKFPAPLRSLHCERHRNRIFHGIGRLIQRRRIMAFRAILLAVCLFAGSATAQHETKVWAVASGIRKIYHCPGSKWYGVGTGREMTECEAIRQGYQPVIGRGCGSGCGRH